MRSYSMQDPEVIIIMGPTAVGKTSAAIRLALELHTKIISADSRQCFKELNIGVARPSPEELQAVPHFFIADHSIREDVTAALFEALALRWTEAIFRDQHTAAIATASSVPTPVPDLPSPKAVMVGGTGLYIRAFTEGLDEMPPIDPALRLHIQQQYDLSGLAWLQDQVREQDPAFYSSGEIHNPQRLMRALEIKRSTGQSILSFRTRGKKQRPFHIRKIGLHLPKEQLHQHIHQRVDAMMEQGLLEEVRSLIPFKDYNALQTVGYTELFDYLEGKSTLAEAVEKIKRNTRHYAKRQMTWFRKDPGIQWVDAAAFASDPLHYIANPSAPRANNP